MKVGKIFILSFLLVFDLRGVFGHGKVMDPVNRLSAWRKGFKTPPNYTDNQGFCGGKEVRERDKRKNEKKIKKNFLKTFKRKKNF